METTNPLISEDQSRKTRAEIISDLNDNLRINGTGGVVILTQRVAQLGDDVVLKVLDAMRCFDDFNDGNNPYGERDFAKFKCFDKSFIWKIDYYDTQMEYHSSDPTCPDVTIRVLTLMFADEY